MMKINYRQTCILVLLSQIALKFLALPSLMYIQSKSESVFAVFMLMLIDGLFAFLILSMAQKSGERNLYEFMCSCLGKVLTKVLMIFLMLKYALTVANITKGLEFFVVDNLYNDFKWAYYVIPLIAVVGFLIYKGINTIARVGEIICWLVIVGIIYITLKSIASADATSFLPLFEDGAMPLVTSSFKHISWFGSSTFLLMLFGKIDFKSKKTWQLVRYIAISIALVLFVYFVFYGIFQITSPTHSFCLSDISQFSSVHSSIDELSWLIVSLWVTAQAVQIAIYSYCLLETIKYIFNIKGEIIPVIIIMVYILLLSLIGEHTVGLEQIFLTPYASILSITAQYVIPIILFIGSVVHGKAEKRELNKKYKQNNKQVKGLKRGA